MNINVLIRSPRQRLIIHYHFSLGYTHELFAGHLSMPVGKPPIGYHGEGGYRRNTFDLRRKPSVFDDSDGEIYLRVMSYAVHTYVYTCTHLCMLTYSEMHYTSVHWYTYYAVYVVYYPLTLAHTRTHMHTHTHTHTHTHACTHARLKTSCFETQHKTQNSISSS